MIRSSALLITAALVLLVAGVVASSLELVYVSVGISILAAIALSIGVVLRRGELFGTAWPERQGGPAGWPAADAAGIPAMVEGRTRTGDGSRGTGDLASVPRPATPATSEAGPARRRDSASPGPTTPRSASPATPRSASPGPATPPKGGKRPAKGGPGVTRRTGDRSAGRAAGGGRPARARSNGREPADGEPAGAGRTDSELGWPRGAGPEQAVSGQDRDQPAAWEEGAASPRPPGFRVPPFGDRPAMAPGGESWGRGSEEAADGGRHDPARPAWPATAGPRAMGTGPAAKSPPAGFKAGGPEPAGGFRPAEPVAPEEQPTPVVPELPEREQDRGEPTATAGSRAHRGLFEPLVTGKPPPLETEPERAGDSLEPAERAGGAGDADEPTGADKSSRAGNVSGTDTAAEAAEAATELRPPPADGRDEEPGKPAKPGADGADGSPAAPLDGQVTIVPGISRYHRRGCILIRFLGDEDLETMTREAAQAAGSVPCKACQPDNPASGG